MDDSLLTQRPSEIRVTEALGLDVTQFVVACPKDVTIFSDAVKTTGADGRLTVRDITALVQDAMRAADQDAPPRHHAGAAPEAKS
jgi:hypothetical protein